MFKKIYIENQKGVSIFLTSNDYDWPLPSLLWFFRSCQEAGATGGAGPPRLEDVVSTWKAPNRVSLVTGSMLAL